MRFDEWPDEPDEPNPEDRWGNPEKDLVDVPKAPEPPEPSGTVTNDVAVAFWGAVISANIAVAGLGIGPMLIFFRGDWDLGLGLVAAGALSLLFTYRRYRAFMTRND
ncbi:MAG: DUF7322 domain-containing protein [Halobacteriota archaeon]